MALPQDGQNANGLTKVTEVPTGKELIFVDPTTNEGGIITLEDLTTQILNKLTSKIFTLDQGNITLIEALNKLNSNLLIDIRNLTVTSAVDSGNETVVHIRVGKLNFIEFNGIIIKNAGNNQSVVTDLPTPNALSVSTLHVDRSVCDIQDFATVYTNETMICIHVPSSLAGVKLYGMLLYNTK